MGMFAGMGMMRAMRNLILLLCTALAVAPLAAEVSPLPTGGDPRIQSVEYDPQQVVSLAVASGYALTVLFSPDERIETVTLGDGSGWQVQVNHRADAMVIRPTGFAPNTNLTVLSDQRSYNFMLSTGSTGFGAQPFMLRFTYPQTQTELAEADPPALTLYKISGARNLRPEQMSDNGSSTSIVWAPDAPLPAVYRDEGRGKMALVNGAMRDGVYVIEGVYRKLVFVLGKDRARAARLEGEVRR